LHHRERAVVAANRVGKTDAIGGYETTLHLTGRYDEIAPWWPGRKWDRPINCLCGGDTNSTTRDIIVKKLLGGEGAWGTGLIPKADIIHIAPYGGVPGHVDFARIRHVSGGESIIQFRSYDQGRKGWQGTERDLGWCDEEPPQDIWTELLLRTATTNGSLMLTATPLSGMTDVMLSFMPDIMGVDA
jgi:phage terminase large subunit-like protein